MPNGIYLLLGTNLGDRLTNLTAVRSQISELAGRIINESVIYETEPWGISDQPNYLNQVIQIDSDHTAEELLGILQKIETQLGRFRNQKWTSRIIDIDILFYQQEIIKTNQLTVPHPYLHKRRFTLIPLAEIAPDFVHPVLKKPISELLALCPDTLMVSPYKGK